MLRSPLRLGDTRDAVRPQSAWQPLDGPLEYHGHLTHQRPNRSVAQEPPVPARMWAAAVVTRHKSTKHLAQILLVHRNDPVQTRTTDRAHKAFTNAFACTTPDLRDRVEIPRWEGRIYVALRKGALRDGGTFWLRRSTLFGSNRHLSARRRSKASTPKVARSRSIGSSAFI